MNRHYNPKSLFPNAPGPIFYPDGSIGYRARISNADGSNERCVVTSIRQRRDITQPLRETVVRKW
jgi:hypothetical protein